MFVLFYVALAPKRIEYAEMSYMTSLEAVPVPLPYLTHRGAFARCVLHRGLLSAMGQSSSMADPRGGERTRLTASKLSTGEDLKVESS